MTLINTEVHESPEGELSEEGRKYVENKAKEYRMQGQSDADAEKLAKEDWGKNEASIKKENDAVWNEVIKKVHLADFLDDQIRRGLGAYKKEWQKKNKQDTIDFKLEKGVVKGGGDGRGIIGGASLTLSYAINGNWKVFRKKVVKFQHVKEMREKQLWSMELYEAMFRDLMGWGITYCLAIDKYNEQNGQQPEPSNNNPTGGTADTSN